MRKKTLSNKLKHVPVKNEKAAAWFYEEPEGLLLTVEVDAKTPTGLAYKDHYHVTIPWRAVKASLSRYVAE